MPTQAVPSWLIPINLAYGEHLRTSTIQEPPAFPNRYPSGTNQESPLPLLVPSALPGGPRLPPNQQLEKHLPYRVWSKSPSEDYSRQDQQRYFKFRLVCYNILSQALLEDNSFLYQNNSARHLKWYRRRDRLFKELFRQDADILCLQEMQQNHYEMEFRPTFMDYGYDSIYLKRSGDKPDGCCIFYRKSRVRLIQSTAVPFYQSRIRLLDRDNCGLIALFQPLVPNATSHDLFCVAATHLLFSPKRGDIKLAQLQYFLAEVDRMASKATEAYSHYPIILCGDFNAQPQSPLVEFLLSGYIKYDNYKCIDISGQTPGSPNSTSFSYPLPSRELLPLSFVTSDCRFPTPDADQGFQAGIKKRSSTTLTHNKRLLSVYDLCDCVDVTTQAGDEPKVVDYIFYSEQADDPHRLSLLSRFELYKQDLMNDVHMPNHQFASDHFLLGATFALTLKQ